MGQFKHSRIVYVSACATRPPAVCPAVHCELGPGGKDIAVVTFVGKHNLGHVRGQYNILSVPTKLTVG